jgi:hypothetical protein
MATARKCKDSVRDLLFDVMALGRYIGPCLSEYAQTTQDKVDHHTYPSGKTVIKAFIAINFNFYDNKKVRRQKFEQRFPPTSLFLSRSLGVYKKTTRMVNRLHSQQRVINLKYAPCAVQCNWY